MFALVRLLSSIACFQDAIGWLGFLFPLHLDNLVFELDLDPLYAGIFLLVDVNAHAQDGLPCGGNNLDEGVG